jgi:hypothetical protein
MFPSVMGLSVSGGDLLSVRSGRNVSKLPKDIIGTLCTKAWYLHANRDGKLYFKNVQNWWPSSKPRQSPTTVNPP